MPFAPIVAATSFKQIRNRVWQANPGVAPLHLPKVETRVRFPPSAPHNQSGPAIPIGSYCLGSSTIGDRLPRRTAMGNVREVGGFGGRARCPCGGSFLRPVLGRARRRTNPEHVLTALWQRWAPLLYCHLNGRGRTAIEAVRSLQGYPAPADMRSLASGHAMLFKPPSTVPRARNPTTYTPTPPQHPRGDPSRLRRCHALSTYLEAALTLDGTVRAGSMRRAAVTEPMHLMPGAGTQAF